jgi:hypothetical protein
MSMNNFQEQFYQVMTNLRRANQSRAASSKQDARVTEIINGVLVSRPTAATIKEQPEVIDLQEYAKSKAASVPSQGINKMKAIHDFIASNGRV